MVVGKNYSGLELKREESGYEFYYYKGDIISSLPIELNLDHDLCIEGCLNSKRNIKSRFTLKVTESIIAGGSIELDKDLYCSSLDCGKDLYARELYVKGLVKVGDDISIVRRIQAEGLTVGGNLFFDDENSSIDVSHSMTVGKDLAPKNSGMLMHHTTNICTGNDLIVKGDAKGLFFVIAKNKLQVLGELKASSVHAGSIEISKSIYISNNGPIESESFIRCGGIIFGSSKISAKDSITANTIIVGQSDKYMSGIEGPFKGADSSVCLVAGTFIRTNEYISAGGRVIAGADPQKVNDKNDKTIFCSLFHGPGTVAQGILIETDKYTEHIL